jgi:hypothetical protein
LLLQIILAGVGRRDGNKLANIIGNVIGSYRISHLDKKNEQA